MENLKDNILGFALINFISGDETELGLFREDGEYKFPIHPSCYFDATFEESDLMGLDHVKGKVLDADCGSGKYSVLLQDRGFEVDGVGNDDLCVKIAKERGVKGAFKDNILMPNVELYDRYDTIWFGFESLGLAGTINNLRKLLKFFESITTSDAMIVGSATDLTAVRDPNPDLWEYFDRKEASGTKGTIKLRYEYKNFVGDWFDWLYISPSDLAKSLEGTVWKMKENLPDSDGTTYSFVLSKT